MESRHFRTRQKIFKIFFLSCPKMPRFYACSRLYEFGVYRISRSISRVIETQNSSQKIDLDLYPGHKKYCPGVDNFFFIFTCLQYLF